MCEHIVETKIENNTIISYCTKCGKILDTRPLAYESIIKAEADPKSQILYD